MNRRGLLQKTAAFGLATTVPFSNVGEEGTGNSHSARKPTALNPLRPPTEGGIPVAFLVSVDAATAPKSVYKGKTYHFCPRDHQEQFDATPERFVVAVDRSKE
jgi:YHS domain-containing protein